MKKVIDLNHENIDSLKYTVQNTIVELHEFMHTCGREETLRLREKIDGVDPTQVNAYAWSLRTSDLKYLCEILRTEQAPELIARIFEILKIRQTKNLFILLWYYFTDNVKNRNLWLAMVNLTGFMAASHRKFYETTLFFKLRSPIDEFTKNAYGLLKDEGSDMQAFLSKYMIMSDTMLAHRLDLSLFCGCGKEILKLNAHYLAGKKEIFKNRMIAGNYLAKLDILDYSNVILNFIEQTHFNRSRFFRDHLEQTTLGKYDRWDRMWQIMLYLGDNTSKTNVWWTFCDHIKKVEKQRAGSALFIFFQKFVIVIPDPANDELFLYRNNEFRNRFETVETGAAKGLSDGDKALALSARDAILNDKFANIYTMSFENINLLYMKDIIQRELESEN